MGHPSRRAFTVIELLVVIGIIAILISLGFLVASRVSGSGKQRVTEQSLRILDSALASYISSNGGKNPPPTIKDPTSGVGNQLIPIVDGRDFSNGTPPADQFINSVGLFMEQMKSDPGAHAQFKDLDPKLVKEVDVDGGGVQPRLLTAIDGWGKPIRYVHPKFKGAITDDPNSALPRQTTSILGNAPTGYTYTITSFRRVGDRDKFATGPDPLDADEGMPLTDRGYFYSCGPDGLPDWTRKPPNDRPNDNIYTATPKFVTRP